MKPNLLFLCQTLPFPPDSGVNIRSYNILRLLSREFNIVALCFYRSKSRTSDTEVADAVRGLRAIAHVEAFEIPQEHNRFRLAVDHVRSCISFAPYTRFAYESASFRRRLAHWLATEHFSLAHIDSLDLLGYVADVEHLPVVCAHHNVESLLLRRRGRHEDMLLKRWYFGFQASLLEKAEREHCGSFALNTVVSDTDRDLLLAIAPTASVVVVPNGVDTAYFQPLSGKCDGLVYAGGINWFPNLDALNHFAGAILPLLAQRGWRGVLRWVGRSSSAVKKRFAGSQVEIVGRVHDVRPFLRDAACYVVPLRVGGGTRLKILDAWAMGKAVVSTSAGCEGLDAVDGYNILVRDDPNEFADAVLAVLSDEVLRRRLEVGARETAERVYSWEVIGEPMLRAYCDVVNEHNGVRLNATATRPAI